MSGKVVPAELVVKQMKLLQKPLTYTPAARCCGGFYPGRLQAIKESMRL